MSVYRHWEFIHSIEKDLVECSNFVAFHEANFATYSNQFAKIIINSCLEIENLFKKICATIAPEKLANTNRPDITLYRNIICSRYSNFPNETTYFLLWEILSDPWKSWVNQKTPNWWRQGYNGIKHNKDEEFVYSNLEHAIDAFSGLYLAAVLYEISKDQNHMPDRYTTSIPSVVHPRIITLSPIPPSGNIIHLPSMTSLTLSR